MPFPYKNEHFYNNHFRFGSKTDEQNIDNSQREMKKSSKRQKLKNQKKNQNQKLQSRLQFSKKSLQNQFHHHLPILLILLDIQPIKNSLRSRTKNLLKKLLDHQRPNRDQFSNKKPQKKSVLVRLKKIVRQLHQHIFLQSTHMIYRMSIRHQNCQIHHQKMVPHNLLAVH